MHAHVTFFSDFHNARNSLFRSYTISFSWFFDLVMDHDHLRPDQRHTSAKKRGQKRLSSERELVLSNSPTATSPTGTATTGQPSSMKTLQPPTIIPGEHACMHA